MRFRMMLVRVGGYSSPDCSAYRAPQDRAITTANFVTYGRAGRTANGAPNSSVQR